MDFYGMKRKRLQSLCKKHGIPANLKNKEMADRLSLIFKGNENPVSGHLGSDNAVAEKDTTFQCVVGGKDKLNVETLDLDSNSVTNNIQMVVASGTGAGNADDCEVKFESLTGMSPGPKGRIDSPPKLDKNSEVKRSESKRNLPPEGRDDNDIGFFYVEENLQKGVNKKQDDDNQELNPAAPSEDVHVDSELFFGNYLVEGEVEELCDKTNVHIEDTCGTRKVIGADAEKQVHTNSPQLGSNMNHVNFLHVSPKESGGGLVEGEVQRLDDNVCVHGDVCNDRNNDVSEAASMCLDASIGAKRKTNITVEDSSSFEDSDETPVQFLPTYPLTEVKTSDLDVNKMVVPGTASNDADTCEVKFVSTQEISRISPASKKMIVLFPNLLNNSETPRVDVGLCDVVEEDMQIGVSKGQVDHSQEILHAEPSVVVMNDDVDLVYDTFEGNLQTGVSKEQVDDNQELNPAAPSAGVHVASELFGDYLVEGEVEKLCDKTDVHIEDTCGTRKVGADAAKQVHTNSPQESNMNHVNLIRVSPKAESGGRLVEEVHRLDDTICVHGTVYNDGNDFVSEAAPMCLDASIGAMVTNGKINVTAEVKTSDIDVHKMVAPDTCEAKFVSSQELSNMSPASEKMIVLSPKLLNNSETPRDDIGLCDVGEEDKEQVDLVQVALEEFGNNLMEGEVEKLDDKIDLLEDVCAFVKQGDNGINSPQGSNINEVGLSQVSPGESSCLPLVGEVEESNNIMHDGVYNLARSGSGGVDHALCFFDTSIASKDSTDGNTNVTKEHFPYDVHSSSVEYSDGALEQFLTTRQLSEVISSDLNIHQIVALDTCEEKLKSSPQKTGPEECIGLSSNYLEASMTEKGFEGEAYFVDPSTVGDVVGTCHHDIKESMQSDNKMEKEKCEEEECSFVEGEVINRLFEYNSDVHDHDIGGNIGAEDGNQSYDMASRKRKKCDPNSDDDKEKPADEFVPTMSQPSEILESCNFNLHQVFASDTASGDEGTYQEEKLESPPKGTPIASSERSISFSPKLLIESSMMHKELESEMNLPMKPERNLVGSCDMKENIKVLDKKEQVGNIISLSKIKFPNKRQPLQDLQQN